MLTQLGSSTSHRSISSRESWSAYSACSGMVSYGSRLLDAIWF
jgi:hypothetical protein